MTSVPNERQFSTSSSATAVAFVNHSPLGAAVVPRTLDRLVAELAEGIQKATAAFYDVHKHLLLGKKPSRQSMDLFLEAKHAFRSEFDALRNILQSIHRHSHGYEVSCQRAPDDRYMSANRCQLSAKALLRDLQTGDEEYEKVLLSFKDQQISLFDLLNAKGQKIARQMSAGMESDIVAKNPVLALYDALDGIQSSLNDIFSFWEAHVSFLKLLVNRQSNFPLPGDETKVTVELWISYQNAILRSSSSISESVDALDVTPVVPITQKRSWRKDTYFSVHAGLIGPNFATVDTPHPVEATKELDVHRSFSSRLGRLFYHLF